jgi:hypothetical protein
MQRDMESADQRRAPTLASVEGPGSSRLSSNGVIDDHGRMMRSADIGFAGSILEES